MFYGSESRDSADVRQCLPLRTTPSVAEQEGQLIETEATEHLKKTSRLSKSSIAVRVSCGERGFFLIVFLPVSSAIHLRKWRVAEGLYETAN
jgi:23S rRNA G2445 N2-methylase RlmL